MSSHPPPTYEASSYRSLWPVVAPYVLPSDLLAACLVSREWHQAFAPELWGDPASRFEDDLDEVYYSLSRFRASLPRARLQVRALTHTFKMPLLESELYEGPRTDWLRVLLEQLPFLQALILPRHQYFDHESLMAVHNNSEDTDSILQKYSLLMLDASNCNNATGTAIFAAIQHFPDLISLDLGGIPGLRNPIILRQVEFLQWLKVLKLGGCRLGDKCIEALRFPASLLSLDISGNDLTVKGISDVLKRLPRPNYQPPSEHRQRIRRHSRSPTYPETLDQRIGNQLRSGPTGLMGLVAIIPDYFAQLNLSQNMATVEDVYSALDHLSLEHLDCGAMLLSNNIYHEQQPEGSLSNQVLRKVELIVHDFREAFQNLRTLRIHHSVLTGYPFEKIPSQGLSNDVKGELLAGTTSLQAVTSRFLLSQKASESSKRADRLRPSHLPNLKTLILTELPTVSPRDDLTGSITGFLQDCVEEEHLARLEQLLRSQSPDNPPDWDRLPILPLGLERLVLEMRTVPDSYYGSSLGDQTSPSISGTNGLRMTRSATEDPDSESFHRAGEGDFSFFDNNNENAMFRQNSVKPTAFGHDRPSLEEAVRKNLHFETIPRIVNFRKEARGRYDRLTREQKNSTEGLRCGHWIGEIKVVWPRT